MKLALALALCATAASSVSAEVLSLTPDNFSTATAGKTVFIKFFAPWCGHCKAMAEDWEKLATEWEGNAVGLIAEVDCTTDENQDFCEEAGVQGFPTLKYGDPSALEDYEGGRDYDSLAEFAKENLKPVCSPKNIDLCDDDQKAEIEKIQAMSVEDINAAIEGVEKKIAELTEHMESEINKLQEKYESLMSENDAAMKAVKKEHNVGLLKSVKAAKEEKTAEEKTADEL